MHYATNAIPHDYVHDATCPIFDDALDTIFADDEDLPQFGLLNELLSTEETEEVEAEAEITPAAEPETEVVPETEAEVEITPAAETETEVAPEAEAEAEVEVVPEPIAEPEP